MLLFTSGLVEKKIVFRICYYLRVAVMVKYSDGAVCQHIYVNSWERHYIFHPYKATCEKLKEDKNLLIDLFASEIKKSMTI